MAGKQLGKLRQWAGEVISSREKTAPTNEFLEMERDIELRKTGIDKLHIASEDYHYSLSRKKFSEAVPGIEKMMSIDSLGVVMIGHGEEFGEESAFGTCLVNFGRAHCRIAALQESYALTLSDTFLLSLKLSAAELADYAVQRKKLESRRLTYDAAISKADRTFKKEKDHKEAEEELQKARARYEETAEDVRARMSAIQENEIKQLRELTAFLELEMNFVEQYLDVLRVVKAEWVDESCIQKPGGSPPKVIPHSFSRVASQKDTSHTTTSKPTLASNFSSLRSFRSTRSDKSRKSTPGDVDGGSSDSESPSPVPLSRSHSSRRKSDAGSKLSRHSSRQSHSRQRADSAATIESKGVVDENEENEKERSKKKSSMTGWVGGAVSSVTGKRKNKVPDKDKFAALGDDEGENEGDDDRDGRSWKRPMSALSNRSGRSNKSKSAKDAPQLTSRHTKDGERKIMKALYDFSGGSDELCFRTGDEIAVVNEVLEGWWMGELGGRRGLFPTNYTEAVKSPEGRPIAPPLPSRPKNASSQSILGLGSLGLTMNVSSEDEESRRTLVNGSVDGHGSGDDDGYVTSDVDDEHPFGDHHLAASRSPLNGGFYAESIESTTDDDDHGERLPVPMSQLNTFSIQGNPNPESHDSSVNRGMQAFRPRLTLQQTQSSASGSQTASPASPAKKAPPPPPPRRQSTNNLLNNAPPLPVRNLTSSRTQSTSSVPLSSIFTSSSSAADHNSTHSTDSSPFETNSELSYDTVAMTGTIGGCSSCDCDEFRQNPFKTHGICASCFHAHG